MTQVVQVCCLPLHEPHQSRRCTRHHINSINELVGSLHTHKHRMVKIRVFVEMIETGQTWIICPCPWPSVPDPLSLTLCPWPSVLISQVQRWRNKRTGNGTRTEGQSCNEHITNYIWYTHLSFCTIVSTTAPTYVQRSTITHQPISSGQNEQRERLIIMLDKRIQCTYIVFPYSGKLSREKTFANRWWFLQRRLSRIWTKREASWLSW